MTAARTAGSAAICKDSRCHSVSHVMYISGAKFKEHCFNISGDIDSVFYCLSGTIHDVNNFLRACVGYYDVHCTYIVKNNRPYHGFQCHFDG